MSQLSMEDAEATNGLKSLKEVWRSRFWRRNYPKDWRDRHVPGSGERIADRARAFVHRLRDDDPSWKGVVGLAETCESEQGILRIRASQPLKSGRTANVDIAFHRQGNNIVVAITHFDSTPPFVTLGTKLLCFAAILAVAIPLWHFAHPWSVDIDGNSNRLEKFLYFGLFMGPVMYCLYAMACLDWRSDAEKESSIALRARVLGAIHQEFDDDGRPV